METLWRSQNLLILPSTLCHHDDRPGPGARSDDGGVYAYPLKRLYKTAV